MEKEDPEFKRKQDAFHKNSTINPDTGSKIIIGSDTYNKLITKYGRPRGQVKPVLRLKTTTVPSLRSEIEIDKHAYLYGLENTTYIDKNKLNKIITKTANITVTDILITLDWLYEVRRVFSYDRTVFGYACTIFFVIIKDSFTINESQLFSLVSLYYAALFLDDKTLDISLFAGMIDGIYSEQEFRQKLVDVFNDINGNMIYSSPILFINNKLSNSKILTDDDIIIYLTLLASTMIEIVVYKPSLIAKTCTYMITGEITVYTKEEMGYICVKISKNIKKYARSKLNNFQYQAEVILSRIRYPCSLEIIKKSVPFKKEQKWQLGDIVLDNVLGEGAYSRVTKITRTSCGLNYVIKETKDEDNKIEAAVIEIALLNLLKNQPEIIHMCGFQYVINKTDIILEIMDGSLVDYYDRLNIRNLSFYFKQILEAVKQCHNHDLIHRDIKLDNLLINVKSGTIKLADFGLSVSFQSSRKTDKTYLANTITYRPPECLLSDKYQYDQKIDIWATGCVFYAMVDKRMLVVNSSSNEEILNDIFLSLGTPTPNSWPKFDSIIKSSDIVINNYSGVIPYLESILRPHGNLILDLLTVNPNRRPTVYEILSKYFG